MSPITTKPARGSITRIPTELWTKILALAISAEERSARPGHLLPTRSEFDELMKFETCRDSSMTVMTVASGMGDGMRSLRIWNPEPTIAMGEEGSAWQRTVRARKRLALVCRKWSSEVFAHLYAHVFVFRAPQLVALVRTLEESEGRTKEPGEGRVGYGQWVRKVTFELVVLPHLVEVFGIAFEKLVDLCPKLECVIHRDAVNEQYWYGSEPSSGCCSPSAQIFKNCVVMKGSTATQLGNNLTSLSLAINEPMSIDAADALLSMLKNLQSLSISLQDNSTSAHSGSIMSLWNNMEGHEARVPTLPYLRTVQLPNLANLTLRDTTLSAVVAVTFGWAMPNLRRCSIDTFEVRGVEASTVIEAFCLAQGQGIQEFLVNVMSKNDGSLGDMTGILRKLPRLERLFLRRGWILQPSQNFTISNLRTIVLLLGDDGESPYLYRFFRALANREYFPLLSCARIIGDSFDDAYLVVDGYIGWPMAPDADAISEGVVPDLCIGDCKMQPDRKPTIALWIGLFNKIGVRLENQEGRRLVLPGVDRSSDIRSCVVDDATCPVLVKRDGMESDSDESYYDPDSEDGSTCADSGDDGDNASTMTSDNSVDPGLPSITRVGSPQPVGVRDDDRESEASYPESVEAAEELCDLSFEGWSESPADYLVHTVAGQASWRGTLEIFEDSAYGV